MYLIGKVQTEKIKHVFNPLYEIMNTFFFIFMKYFKHINIK